MAHDPVDQPQHGGEVVRREVTKNQPIGLARHGRGQVHADPVAQQVVLAPVVGGRLGTYRYLDMDRTIDEALTAAAGLLDALAAGTRLPAFFVDPT